MSWSLGMKEVKRLANRRASVREGWVRLGVNHGNRVYAWSEAMRLLADTAQTIDDPNQWSEIYGNDRSVYRAWVNEFVRGLAEAGAGRHFILAALRGDKYDALQRYRANQGDEVAQRWCVDMELSYTEPRYPAHIAAQRLEAL